MSALQHRPVRRDAVPGEDAGVLGPAALVVLGLAVIFWAAFFAEGWL